MSKWEYKILEQRLERVMEGLFSSEVAWKPDMDLDSLGAKGWELVTVVPIDVRGSASATSKLRHYFKRETY